MSHWTQEREAAGSVFFMRLTFLLYRILKLRFIGIFLHPLTFFYFCVSPQKRRISCAFFARVNRFTESTVEPFLQTYRHFYSFSLSLIEKIAAWNNDLSVKDLQRGDEAVYQEVIGLLHKKKGLILLGSHLGNMEFLRALAMLETHEVEIPVNIILNTGMTQRFNALLSLIQSKFAVNIFDSAAININTICILQEKLEKGEILVIAGDRTVGEHPKKCLRFSFLGTPAFFPYGAFLIPVLLKFPVYYFFALRKDDKLKNPYIFSLVRSTVDCSSVGKSAAITALAGEFVSVLERKTAQYPFQWYNFYDFWSE